MNYHVCIDNVVHFKNTHIDMNGLPHIIDETNHHGKSVMPNMGYLNIKWGCMNNMWNKRRNDMYFSLVLLTTLGSTSFSNWCWKGNIICPHCFKTMCFNQGFSTKKGQYPFAMYKVSSRNPSCVGFYFW